MEEALRLNAASVIIAHNHPGSDPTPSPEDILVTRQIVEAGKLLDKEPPMTRRRSNNEGTVFQDKDGVWWAQLPPDERGKRPKRRAKTQREAQEKLR